MAKSKGKVFVGPKSICLCGHTGDGEDSDHGTGFGPGHGACMVSGCNCFKFSWARFTKKYERFTESPKGGK